MFYIYGSLQPIDLVKNDVGVIVFFQTTKSAVTLFKRTWWTSVDFICDVFNIEQHGYWHALWVSIYHHGNISLQRWTQVCTLNIVKVRETWGRYR